MIIRSTERRTSVGPTEVCRIFAAALKSSPVCFQVSEQMYADSVFFQANKSTRVLLIADRVMKLPSPAHPRNSSEQRVHPSWFYLGTLSTKLRIQFFVLLWFSWQNTASFGECETRRFFFCDVTSGRIILFCLPGQRLSPLCGWKVSQSTMDCWQHLGSSVRWVLPVCGVHPAVTST